MATAHESRVFLNYLYTPLNVTKITLGPSKLIMATAFLKCTVQLKGTENWKNRIKNYLEES